MDGDVAFEGGRDLVYWGNGLTLAQVVDGVMPAFSWKNVTLQTVSSVTPTRTVDFEPVARLRLRHPSRFLRRCSASLSARSPCVYGLIQRDYNVL